MSDPDQHQQPQQWDLGPVNWIDADAVGQPGQRTFRLRMRRGGTTATIWLEKEQLQMLGVYVEQLMGQLPEHLARGSTPDELMPDARVDYPEEPTVQFRAYRLALGFDEAADMIAILAHRVDDDEDADDEDVDEDDDDAASIDPAELQELIERLTPESVASDPEQRGAGSSEAEGQGESDDEDDDEDEDDAPTLICRASRRQLRALSERITRVVNAGRPRCPLCGAPMPPGQPHVCPRSNGYHKTNLADL